MLSFIIFPILKRHPATNPAWFQPGIYLILCCLFFLSACTAYSRNGNSIVTSSIPVPRLNSPAPADKISPSPLPNQMAASRRVSPESAAADFPMIISDDFDRESLKQVIENQLAVMQHANLSQQVRLGRLFPTKGELKETLEAFLNLLRQTPDAQTFYQRVREEFAFYKAGNGKRKKMLFTGYYTPVIEASLVRTEEYIYPLYRLPDDPTELSFISQGDDMDEELSAQPWRTFTRKQIDHYGILQNQNLEIAWLKDDLERFFLHIQGSGMLLLPTGKTQGLRFAGANSYDYAGIGKLMMKDGVLGPGQRSMQGIKKYLREHPEEIPKYFYQNKRYIFFAFTDEGPKGAGGGELIGGRSIATDKSIYAPGGLALIFVRKPVLNGNNEIAGWKRVARFVVDQDTGSDIKGPGRADFYFGTGYQAGVMAGNFKEWGEVYYLLKKD